VVRNTQPILAKGDLMERNLIRDRYLWISDGNPDISHIEMIAAAGFGEVHKVSVLIFTDLSKLWLISTCRCDARTEQLSSQFHKELMK